MFLLVVAIACAAPAPATVLEATPTYNLTFQDVDQRKLSIADGHITVIIVTTRRDENKARAVGDRVPREFVGDSHYRVITLINFQRNIPGPLRGIISALVRRRLNQEAARIQPTYTAKKVSHSPRDDLFVVADFDGAEVTKLGMSPTAEAFAVFIFDGRGRLLKQWNDLPSSEALGNVLRQGHGESVPRQ